MKGFHLLVSEQFMLNCWGSELSRLFPKALMVAHVGSSLERADYRDVDVRVIMFDEDFAVLEQVATTESLNVALSLWGQKMTGLPIDCQVQSWAESKTHDGKPRNGMQRPPRPVRDIKDKETEQ